MLTVKEGSRQQFQLVFEDESRLRFMPQTVRYRLDDTTHGGKVTLLDWTTVDVTGFTVEDPLVITLPSSLNRILYDYSRFEMRVLTVQSDFDTDIQLSDEEQF